MDAAWLRVGLVALALGALTLRAHAYYPPAEWSYALPTRDGKHLFVMIGSDRPDFGPQYPEPLDARKVRLTYAQSGLYRNDGSLEPLWTVNRYIPSWDVSLSPDGVYMVVCRHAPSELTSGAVSFYVNGEWVLAYSVDELVDNSDRLPRVASRDTFFWCKEESFDPETLRYSVTTADGNRFVFDATTGEIVYAWRPARWWFKSFALLIAAPLLLRGAAGFIFPERFLASRKGQYNANRPTRLVYATPFLAAAILIVIWYATLEHYRPWGWIVTAFVTGAGTVGFIHLLRWPSPSERPVDRPRRTSGADIALVALGLAFVALGVWVY